MQRSDQYTCTTEDLEGCQVAETRKTAVQEFATTFCFIVTVMLHWKQVKP